MAPGKLALRVIKISTLALVCLFLVLFVAVQAQQWLFRWRAEQLMADMHQIRLYQSTWADAQRLMHRWGAWGHYDGSCTATDCRYEIRLDNQRPIPPVLHFLGARYATMNAAFILQDSGILRTSMTMFVDVPPPIFRPNEGGYELIVSTKSRNRLGESNTREPGGLLGPDEQLLDHPDYKERSPDGCENCMAVDVSYATHTPQSEIERLTTFDLSCVPLLHEA